MYSKYWQKLLSSWRKEGRDGLTIPFLIGAQKYFQDNNPQQTVDDLIIDIAKSDGFEVYITYCMTIKELILGMRVGQKLNIAGSHLNLDNGEKSNFFVTKFVIDLGSDLPTVCATLTEKFQYHIDNGQFSTNQLEWTGYTLDDMEFIRRCADDNDHT
jgi:hypothetical protein